MKKIWVGILVVLFTVSSGAELPKLKLPPVHKSTLGNGTKLFIVQDAELPLTQIQLIFKHGAVQDPKGQEGLANMAGELLLRGTKKLSKERLRERFEQIGARVGVSVGSRETGIFITTLTSALDEVLEILDQVIYEANPTEKELNQAKKEQIEELKGLPDRSFQMVQAAFKEFVDPENPYAHLSTGHISAIEKIQIAQIKKSQSELLRGGNLAVGALSDLDPKILKEKLERCLGKMPQGESPDIPVPADSSNPGLRVLVLDKKKLETMHMAFGHVATDASSPERVPLLVTNYMFGSAPLVNVLFREVRSNRGWTYGISSNYSFPPYRGPFVIYLFPTTKFGIEALKLSMSLYNQYITLGVPPSDLAYSKRALINQAPFLFETSEDVLGKVLDEELRKTPHGYYEHFVENVAKVNSQNSLEALGKVHKQRGLALVIMGDADKIVPEIKKMDDLAKVQVVKAENYFR